MPEPFIGEIRIYPGSLVPVNWARCDGQILPISSNIALFSIIGTTYGGNGVNTFALPDLRGRVPIHFGQGPGLTNRVRGQAIGEEGHSLGVGEMPAHTHSLGASTNGNSDAAAGSVMARSPAAIPQYESSADTNLGASAVSNAGAGQTHNNMQPYLAMSFIICLNGVYPQRG